MALDLSGLDPLWFPRLSSVIIAEPGRHPDTHEWHWTERHLQCIWADDRLRPREMRSATGETIEVVDAGRWNLEAGPDFLNATIRIGGKILKGDVEVHIRPADWVAHGHSQDPRYADVILHVTWFPAQQQSAAAPMPPVSIALRDCLMPAGGFPFDSIDLSAFPHAILPGTPRPCGKALANATPDEAKSVLEAAGASRLRRKALHFAQRLQETGSRNQVFYEEFMRALGYKSNAGAMRALAGLVPIETLCAQGEWIARYALLLGTAGLLPKETKGKATAANRRLWDIAWKLGVADSSNGPQWNTSGVRPSNHPRKRLAAAAALFSTPGDLLAQFDRLPRRTGSEWANGAWNAISRTLEMAGDSIGPEAGKLGIGAQRVNAIVANVLLPLAMAEGILDVEIAHDLPGEAANAQTRETAHRLFGRDHNPALYSTSGLRMQGLLEICNSFCLSTKNLCADCSFGQTLTESAKARQLTRP